MAAYLRGAGTISDPFVIHNSVALKQLFTLDCSSESYFEVVADIDCGGEVFSYYSASSGVQFRAKVNLNGHKIINFTLNNNYGNQCIYYIFSGSFEFGHLIFKTSSTGMWGWAESSTSFVDMVVDTGKTGWGSMQPTGGFTRCYFPQKTWTSISKAIDCYCNGAMTGAVNVSAAKYDPNSYPAMKASPEKWILDGVSEPNTKKRDRSELTTGYAIKGTTRVGNSRKSRNVTILSGAYRRPIWEGKSDGEGKFFAPLYDYYDAVMPLIFDDYGYPLKKDTNYVVGDIIHPSTPNGYRYICEQVGISGPTLPAEPWSVEVLLTAGTAKFRPYPVYEPKCLGPIYPGKANLITGEKV
jgi:hypothetical protein